MFTQENRELIKNIDLYQFVISIHRNDIEIYNNWVRLKCNPSVNIHKCSSKWIDFSSCTTSKYGDAISLLTRFWGYTFKDAVDELNEYLAGKDIHTRIIEHNQDTDDVKKIFCMPIKSPQYPRTVYSYLGKTRHIPYKLIDILISQGYVYMTDKYVKGKTIHNVVFTTPQKRYFEIRGCNTYGKAFHQSQAMTEKDCLILPGNSNRPKKIYITEAAIDAISLLAIHGLEKNIEDAWYVGLGGILKTKPIDYLKTKYPDVEIILAVDNDKAGDKMREAYKDIFRSIIPKGKDWNDDLCEMFTN